MTRQLRNSRGPGTFHDRLAPGCGHSPRAIDHRRGPGHRRRTAAPGPLLRENRRRLAYTNTETRSTPVSGQQASGRARCAPPIECSRPGQRFGLSRTTRFARSSSAYSRTREAPRAAAPHVAVTATGRRCASCAYRPPPQRLLYVLASSAARSHPERPRPHPAGLRAARRCPAWRERVPADVPRVRAPEYEGDREHHREHG
jgi:hypothetical protein